MIVVAPRCCYCCYVALEVPAKINGSLSHSHGGTTKTAQKETKKKSGKILEREHHHHRDRCVRFNASGLRERQRNVPGMEGLDS